MDNDARYIIDKEIMYTDLDDETVLFNNRNQFYYSLNPVGVEVFHLLLKEKTFGEIIVELLKIFEDVSEDELRKDVEEIILDLEGENIVKPRE